jgi:flagellar protein FlaG
MSVAAPASEMPAAPPQRAVAVAPAAAATALPSAADERKIDAAIAAAHQFLHPVAANLRFVRDDSSGRTLIQLVDSETQKVLRQIPSEEMLAINKALDRMQGLMVHLKV